MTLPHPDTDLISVKCSVVTVSDTRTVESDRSGQLIQQLLIDAGHRVTFYTLVKDEPEQIQHQVKSLLAQGDCEVLILNGGTGIAPRDTTYDAIEAMLDKVLPGFGEIFRWLSYQQIGSRAMASRAIAGTCQTMLLFSLPGSSNAVRLAMEELILPEMRHLVRQLRP